MKRAPVEEEISVEFEGKTYSTTYIVKSGVVEVQTVHGPLAIMARGSAKAAARTVFIEHLQGLKARGELS